MASAGYTAVGEFHYLHHQPDGTPYAKLGGGLKRFRVTKNVGGYWTNTWMTADEAHWINSTDLPRIAARPQRYQRAHETIQITQALWGSWQHDAWLKDTVAGRFADPGPQA